MYPMIKTIDLYIISYPYLYIIPYPYLYIIPYQDYNPFITSYLKNKLIIPL